MAREDRLLHEKCLDSSDWPFEQVCRKVWGSMWKNEHEREQPSPAKARAQAMLQVPSRSAHA